MSGGRGTLSAKKGQTSPVSGDICAVMPEGHLLTDFFQIECKAYKDLELRGFFTVGSGALSRFWIELVKSAKQHNKVPMLIAKQNRVPILVLTEFGYQRQPSAIMPRIGCEVGLFSTMVSFPFAITRLRLNVPSYCNG